MNIYLIEQKENNDYDSYDSAVVAAENENTAKRINPANGEIIIDFHKNYIDRYCNWCSDIKHVKCTLIGKAKDNVKQGVILSSYNAG